MLNESNPDAAPMESLLEGTGQGDASSTSQLFELLYGELRIMARAVFDEGRGHTLQPTALVHEVWLKLAGNEKSVENEHHFLALAAKAMRQVLADHARARGRAKRGGSHTMITLHSELAVDKAEFDVIAFNELLDQLTQLNARHAQVLELRILGGMTIDEVAASLGVSRGTVELDWSMAKAWFRARLTER